MPPPATAPPAPSTAGPPGGGSLTFGLTFDDAKIHYDLDLINIDDLESPNVGPLTQCSPRSTRRFGINDKFYTLYRAPEGGLMLWDDVKKAFTTQVEKVSNFA